MDFVKLRLLLVSCFITCKLTNGGLNLGDLVRVDFEGELRYYEDRFAYNSVELLYSINF
jgi:hypothetical protein